MAMAGAAVLFSGMAFSQMMPSNPGGTAAQSNAGPNSPSAMQDQMNNGMAGQANADKMFVHDALMGGMAEVQLGQLATQKGSSDAVKTFGQKMVDDHTKMGEDMKPIAKKLSVPVPTKLDAKDQALYNKLEALSGTDFDNAYIKAMVKDHKKDDSEFRAEAQNAADPDLKMVAAKGEQIISQHLQMIEGIAKTNNVASK